MKSQNLKELQLICKKCNGVRNKMPLKLLPKNAQKEFKQVQKEMAELDFKFVYCEKCNEHSMVSSYQTF